jgi:hypothetical protein
MTPSTFVQYLGPTIIMSLVMETLDESHILVTLVNRDEETQNKQGNILFREHFRRLRIAEPDSSHLFPVGFQIGQTIGLLDLSAASGCWARCWDAVSASVAI